MLCVIPVNNIKKQNILEEDDDKKFEDMNDVNILNNYVEDRDDYGNCNGNDNKLHERSHLDYTSNKFISDADFCVSYNKLTKYFKIKNLRENKEIGTFNVNNIIKYFVSIYDNKFMSDIDEAQHTNSVIIIKKFIGYNTLVNTDGINNIHINLHSHTKSPIMGDLNTLVRINNELYMFQKNGLEIELENINPDNKNKVRTAVGLLINKLLGHTLNIIAHASEEIKNDPKGDKIKSKLYEYSIGITYRIHEYVENEVACLDKKITKLFEKLEQSENLRIDANNKISNLTKFLPNIEHNKSEKENHTYEINSKLTDIYNTLHILIDKQKTDKIIHSSNNEKMNIDEDVNININVDNAEEYNEHSIPSEKYNNPSSSPNLSPNFNSDSDPYLSISASDANNGSIILGTGGIISVNEYDDKNKGKGEEDDIIKRFDHFMNSQDDSDKILDIILKK